MSKLQDLQKQISAAASKPDAVTEVRDGLAKLGSRVEEMSVTVDKLKAQQINKASESSNQNADKTKDANASGDKTNK